MALTKLQKAEQALENAQAADRATINKESKDRSTAASKASELKIKKELDMGTKLNSTLEGESGDSERKKVIVERKYTESTARIFASTVINKNGKAKLEQFKIPVNVEVELPVEIITMLKERKTPKQTQDHQTLVPEFVVTEA